MNRSNRGHTLSASAGAATTTVAAQCLCQVCHLRLLRAVVVGGMAEPVWVAWQNLCGCMAEP
eukprot:3601500-Prorocentrum_lima.AAC.1